MIIHETAVSNGKIVKFPVFTAEVRDYMAVRLVGKKWVDEGIKGVHPEHVSWIKLARRQELRRCAPVRLIECCTGLVLDASLKEERDRIHTVATKSNDGYIQMTPEEMQIYYTWRNKRDSLPDEPGVATVTPEFVEEALAANRDNRKPRPSHINEIMRVIARGHWTVINQGLGFDRLGRLSDGQQRLIAIKNCGCPPIKIQVTRNISVMGRIYMDSRLLKRMALDHLKFEYKVSDMDATSVAICRCSLAWIYRTRDCPVPVHKKNPATAIGASEIFPWHNARRWAFDRVHEVKGSWLLPAPILGAFIDRYFDTGNQEITNMLNLVVEEPVNVPANRAVTALRDFIDRWKGKASGGASSQRMRYFAASETILSWLEGDSKLFNGDMLDHVYKTLTITDIEKRQESLVKHTKVKLGRTAREHPEFEPENGDTDKRTNGRVYSHPAPFVR